MPSPFVALHEVESADVFTSAAYRAQAGPGNTGEWHPVALPPATAIHWLEAVGLDRSVPRRGLAVMLPLTADTLADRPGVRVLRPLARRLVAPR